MRTTAAALSFVLSVAGAARDGLAAAERRALVGAPHVLALVAPDRALVARTLRFERLLAANQRCAGPACAPVGEPAATARQAALLGGAWLRHGWTAVGRVAALAGAGRGA